MYPNMAYSIKPARATKFFMNSRFFESEETVPEATKPSPARPCLPDKGSPEDTTLRCKLFIQTMLILILFVLITIPIIPAMYVFLLFPNQNIFLLQYLLPLIVYSIIFSIFFLVLKWVVIGKYQTGTFALWGSYYTRWWFVDRLVDIWEMMVGQFVINTPYVALFYKLLGANISLFCHVETFLREFDLVTAEQDTVLKGNIYCRMIDYDGITLSNVTIVYRTKMKPWSALYPGETISTRQNGMDSTNLDLGLSQNLLLEGKSKAACSTYVPRTWTTKCEKIAFPIVTLSVYASSIALISLCLNLANLQSKELEVILAYAGSHFLVFVFSGLLTRLKALYLFPFTIDGLARISFYWMDVLIDSSPFFSLLYTILFGAKIGWNVYFKQNQYFVLPSSAHTLTIGKGSIIEESYIGSMVSVGTNCKIGSGSVVMDKVVLDKGAIVTPLSVITANQFIPQCKTENIIVSSCFITLFGKIGAVWVPLVGIVWVNMYIINIISKYSTGFITNIYIYPLIILCSIFMICFVSIFLIASIAIRYAPESVSDTYSFLVEKYVRPFFAGSFIWNLLLCFLGVQMKNKCNTIVFGSIQGQGLVTFEDGCIVDRHAIVRANSNQVSALGKTVLHPASYVLNQSIGDGVVIAIRSRACGKRIIKTKSGIYFGDPAVECD
jgi:hypothetical protein